MKYLRKFESISKKDIIEEIRYILQHLDDAGFSISIWSKDQISVIIEKLSPFNYSDISDSVHHLISYMKSNNYKVSDIDIINNKSIIKSNYYLKKIIGKDFENIDNFPIEIDGYFKIYFSKNN